MSSTATAENPATPVHFAKRPAGTPELTLRALVVGCVVAALVGGAYPYVVMKIGYGPNTSIVSAIFGYITLGLFFKNFTRWENNMVQTAGTSAGAMAFLCVIMAAFDMLRMDPTLNFHLELTPFVSFLWLSTAGVLGVLMAVPMRKHLIVDEKLPYVDGVVVAETLVLLDSRGKEAKGGTIAMTVGGLVSAVLTVLREDSRVLAAAWYRIPEMMGIGQYGHKLAFGVTWSLLPIASGMLMGLRISLSMLLGAVLAWHVAPPLLVQYGAVPEIARRKLLLWIMWPATGMMVAAGLTVLALRWKVLVRTFTQLSASSIESGDFPMRWVVGGTIAATVVLAIVQKAYLGMTVWMTVAAVVFSIPLMLVGLRVYGETNWGPISTMSNMMQAVFGVIAPGAIGPNMVSSAVTGSIASESEGLMQDFKTGQLIDSTPKYLTYMQLITVPIGAAAVSCVYPLLRDTYGIGGETGLQSPISQKWAGFAALLSKGLGGLPPGALTALIVGVAVGVLLTLLEQTKWRKRLPSATSIGMGMLVPASFAITMTIGALIDWAWTRWNDKSRRTFVVPLASGFAVGEAIVAVIVPILATIGLLKLQP